MRHGVCKILVRDGVDVSGSTLIQKRRGASVEQDDSAIIDWNNRVRHTVRNLLCCVCIQPERLCGHDSD